MWADALPRRATSSVEGPHTEDAVEDLVALICKPEVDLVAPPENHLPPQATNMTSMTQAGEAGRPEE